MSGSVNVHVTSVNVLLSLATAGGCEQSVVDLGEPAAHTWWRCSTLCLNVWTTAIKSPWRLENATSTTKSISGWLKHPFQGPLLSKRVHSDLGVSSWIIPAPFCKLLPAPLLSVWVCLCISHSLLNCEEQRYFEWTSEVGDSNMHVQLPSQGEGKKMSEL